MTRIGGVRQARLRRALVAGAAAFAALGLSACGSASYLVLKNNGEAMDPTATQSQHVKVEISAYTHSAPKIGDVILYHPPVSAIRFSGNCVQHVPRTQLCPKADPNDAKKIYFLGRIVAGPGDTVAVRDGHAIRNGVIASAPDGGCTTLDCTLSGTVKLGPGQYFVMGDDRAKSFDSRFWGPLPRSFIVGKALGTTSERATGQIGLH